MARAQSALTGVGCSLRLAWGSVILSACDVAVHFYLFLQFVKHWYLETVVASAADRWCTERIGNMSITHGAIDAAIEILCSMVQERVMFYESRGCCGAGCQQGGLESLRRKCAVLLCSCSVGAVLHDVGQNLYMRGATYMP